MSGPSDTSGKPGEAPEEWTSSCPICGRSPLQQRQYRRGLLRRRQACFRCPYCGARFIRHATGYRLDACNRTRCERCHRYRNQTLTTQEWARVAHGGVSDAEERRADEQKELKQRNEDLEEFQAALEAGEIPLKGKPSHPSVLLESGEEAYFDVRMNLSEARAARYAPDELKILDNGVLTVTNMRLVFGGPKRTTDMPLEKIAAVHSLKDGVAIGLRRNSKTKVLQINDAHPPVITASAGSRRHTVPLTGPILKAFILGIIKRRLGPESETAQGE